MPKYDSYMNIFLAPHSMDEVLYGSFIIQRVRPLVMICTNNTLIEAEYGVPIEILRTETIQACKILGAKVVFLGIDERDLTIEEMYNQFGTIPEYPNRVFAPWYKKGNRNHDVVSEFTHKYLKDTLYYSTYSNKSLIPTGELELKPTRKEIAQKKKALSCYKSQLVIEKRKKYIDAVKNQSEYLNFNP